MSKTLAVLLVVGLAVSAAWAANPLVLLPTKDMGVDNYNAGPHHSRGADGQMRFDKNNEWTVLDFDRDAIKAYITANLEGQTLSQAISGGRISVQLSIVPAAVLPANTLKQVMCGALYSPDNWVENVDGAGGSGSDINWNWTGAGHGPDVLNDLPEVIGTVRAATPLSPWDVYHNPMDYDSSSGGGGEWRDSMHGWSHQQFKNLPISPVPQNLDFGAGWAVGVRQSTNLDPSIWCDYIYNKLGDGVTPNGHGWVLNIHSGDCQNDGKVDVVDLGILAKNYDLQTGGTWATADFNKDGKVDVVDLGILAKNYDWAGTPATTVSDGVPAPWLTAGLRLSGYDDANDTIYSKEQANIMVNGVSTMVKPQLIITILPAGGAAVPEPVTLSLLAAGAVALIRRRR